MQTVLEKPPMLNKARLFIVATSCILIITALAKLLSGLGEAPLLTKPTAALPAITHRQLLILGAMVEFSMIAFLLSRQTAIAKLYAILWFSSLISIYRLGSWWINPAVPCPCLGNISDWIPIPPQILDKATLALLVFMLLGSAALLLATRRLTARTSDVINEK
jgi:hypothetical protein